MFKLLCLKSLLFQSKILTPGHVRLLLKTLTPAGVDSCTPDPAHLCSEAEQQQSRDEHLKQSRDEHGSEQDFDLFLAGSESDWDLVQDRIGAELYCLGTVS